MPTRRRCPSELCGHREYLDCSDRTCTPEPMCPECMKMLNPPDPWGDGSNEDFEESY